MRTVIIFCLCLFTFTVQAQDDVNYTYMDSLFQQLPEVLVKGERPVVKAERGKLIYDLPRMVERLPVNNAYEAVKELPGIVEQDGNLTLGARGITVVINGKVSTWNGEFCIKDKQLSDQYTTFDEWNKIYNSERVLTLDELPNLRCYPMDTEKYLEEHK